MNQRLEVGVLGPLRVVREGQAVSLPPSRKTRALLAYLAVQGRPQRRERLCEMFWEVPDDPRGSLRWSLSKIRQVLKHGDADPIEARRDTVLLRTDDIELDCRKLSGLNADALANVDTGALERAAAAFRGAFLEDLYLPRCPDFEAWRVAHADRLEILRMKILRVLVQRLRDEPERALPYAHTLRELGPDDSTLTRAAEELASAARASVVASAPAHSAPAPEAPVRTQEIRFCRARDGARIAYAVSGRGPPIVRAAHWMSHLEFDWESPVWRHWIDGLSQRNTLIRYDERCCGLSDWAAEDVSFEAMIDDLEKVVDAAGLDRFVLLGLSQSCAVSVAYAVRHPERITHLVLYGGYVRGWRKRGNPREIATREALSVLMREGWGRDHPIFRELFTTTFIPGASREQMDWFNELQLRTISPANAYRLQHAFADIDVSDLLPQVRVPTLVIHARQDKVAPVTEGVAFAAGIGGARYVELDSANHVLLQGEQAFARFLEELRGFIATPPVPAASATRSR
ncbi:alpha/beta hydrolase [Azospirillum soli]|uniref:alpha/beta hydrolase n=1 Tax=Azospirillum soli TaxID=1304799 RepID=UPI001AEB5CC2|nr:alpha/beta hydrolase [Azospirillum soli]MBP2314561.1 pimeloyl-ACP methyl ester carboxylesterase/DNA-binding SARP family transcriptional activator [Azospirillum soli]